jgi:hypothetical protein
VRVFVVSGTPSWSRSTVPDANADSEIDMPRDVTPGQAEWVPDEPGEFVPPDVVVSFNRHGDILDVREQRIRPPFNTPPPLAVPRPVARRRQPRSRSVRTGARRARAPSRLGDDDPEPPPHPFDVGRLAAASVRLWAHEQRRLARRRVAA